MSFTRYFRTNNRIEGWHNGFGKGLESNPPFHRYLEAVLKEVHQVRRHVIQANNGVENVQIQAEVDRQVRDLFGHMFVFNPSHLSSKFSY